MGNEITVCHSVWGYAIVCSSAGQGGPSIYFIKVYRKQKEPAIGKNYQSETQTKLVIVSRLEGHCDVAQIGYKLAAMKYTILLLARQVKAEFMQ